MFVPPDLVSGVIRATAGHKVRRYEESPYFSHTAGSYSADRSAAHSDW